MNRLLSDIGIELPVLAAPMAGGPSTPELVAEAARSGSLGFLAGGYKTAEALAEQIQAVRAENVPFGVNLFVANPVPVAPEDYRRYARTLQPEADRFGLTLDEDAPMEDDDDWDRKIALVSELSVPWVSFTFGIPDPAVIQGLRRSGTTVLQNVTSADEARSAAEAGVDALVVQASAAGGHSATLTPHRPLDPASLPDAVASVRHATTLPLIAAGGIATPGDAAAALRAGADATMVGTLLLRTHESGASPAHQAALADPSFDTTVVTRAFTGRPARALRNHFAERYDVVAPAGYPAVHHLTAPLRKAAAAAGDARLVHLWAGTGFREAREEGVAQTLHRLADPL
ncbi:nitronate monooxygenase [Actinacidiphila acidipaludis]|uniref:Propionate 3-nitronate monooxygenase n=1 Tax=Actinacidiphila acidipaludis TaxID=2873382 RepID=A0ABS7Q2R4_9ACTN|nr:nitronate monooxygenase [Streptomyces acidipaludis]MBY8876347.1 nitronate monooxygenase [Streptomyces acidipaludis]